MANMAPLTDILDEVSARQPMAHWAEVFGAVHVTFGPVRGPEEVIQRSAAATGTRSSFRLEGAGSKVTSHDQQPDPRCRASPRFPRNGVPDLESTTTRFSSNFGFDAKQIEGFRASGHESRKRRRPAKAAAGGWTMNEILTERSGSILKVQLNRPAKKNAITTAMYVALAEALETAAKDDATRVVLTPRRGRPPSPPATISRIS